MAFIDDLITQRDALLLVITNAQTQLNDMLQSKKPSYNIDGQQVSWTEYQAMLNDIIMDGLKNLELLNQLIMQNQPYFFSSRIC